MQYVSITTWRDLESKHLYHAGEKYPFDGQAVSAERAAELSGTQNKAGYALIEAFKDPDEGKPADSKETPRKAVKSRKKGD